MSYLIHLAIGLAFGLYIFTFRASGPAEVFWLLVLVMLVYGLGYWRGLTVSSQKFSLLYRGTRRTLN